MQELITQAEYARRIGKTRACVNKWVKQGKIPTVGGKISQADADFALRDNGHPSMHLQKAADELDLVSPTKDSYSDAKTKQADYTARIKQLEYEKLVGDLVEKNKVRREIYAHFRELRNKLLAMPSRVAGEVVTKKTEREVTALLEDYINELLKESAKAMDHPPPGESVTH